MRTLVLLGALALSACRGKDDDQLVRQRETEWSTIAMPWSGPSSLEGGFGRTATVPPDFDTGRR